MNYDQEIDKKVRETWEKEIIKIAYKMFITGKLDVMSYIKICWENYQLSFLAYEMCYLRM